MKFNIVNISLRNMSENDVYVGYETAELLRQAGFNVKTKTFYNSRKLFLISSEMQNWNGFEGPFPDVSAPTQASAQKWLREALHVNISIEYDVDNDNYKGMINYPGTYYCVGPKDTYEELVETAIKIAVTFKIENLL